ncbi:MAG: crossover junction endodeoxyribonuclease RuvC [Elusimicrobia bacterium]|nr:crossover junction endodeoxyribonuclease RuvC [Elusimicrobiota bacterium]
MRIMGIDPGLAKVGWGIVDTQDRDSIILVEYGCITTSGAEPINSRLDTIYRIILDLIKKYRPAEVALEKLFFSSNTKTAIDVAQARGAVLVALNHSGLILAEYTPLEIKQALVGYGRAKKNQVQFMVKNFLKLEKEPRPDHAADALAVAICHNNSKNLKGLG